MSAKCLAAVLVAATTWSLAAGAWARSDGDDAARPRALDCEPLPEQALTRLPAHFDAWVRLDCLASSRGN